MSVTDNEVVQVQSGTWLLAQNNVATQGELKMCMFCFAFVFFHVCIAVLQDKPHVPGTLGDQSTAKPSVMCPEKLKSAAASFCCLMNAAIAAELWTASNWDRRSKISTCPLSDHTAANDCSPT